MLDVVERKCFDKWMLAGTNVEQGREEASLDMRGMLD